MLTGDALSHSPYPTPPPYPAAHLSRVTANRDPKGSRQSKISQFQLPILREMGGIEEGLFNCVKVSSLIAQPLAPASPISHPLPERYPVYEQVLGLQVSVQHIATVTKSQAF